MARKDQALWLLSQFLREPQASWRGGDPFRAPLCSALIHQGEGLTCRFLAQGQALPRGTSGLSSKVILAPREREKLTCKAVANRPNGPQWGCASSLVSSSPDPAPLWRPGPAVRSSVSILCHLCSGLLPSSLLTRSLPFDTPPPHPKPLIPSYL